MKKNKLIKKWWFWVLAVVFFPIFCLYGIYCFGLNYRKTKHRRWIVGIISLTLLVLIGFTGWYGAFAGSSSNQTVSISSTEKKSSSSTSKSSKESVPQKQSSSVKKSSSTKESSSKTVPKSTTAASKLNNSQEILAKLINYTNEKSAGPTKNYYWDNGTANLSGFETMKAGDYHFSADNQGRSGVARAILTYSEFEASKGARQGSPLDPPAWPVSNPKIAITFSLTGKTYHGYLYNRSHSIADSLLGSSSYTSKYNFTTGTRSQNVGADQNGGMRTAEELAENYWKNHSGTNNTIQYQTTPLYNGNETVPRGSIVDEKSSDGLLNVEIVVINDAEGITINYNSETEVLNPQADKTFSTPASSSSIPPKSPDTAVSVPTDTSYTTNGGWSTAANGMVFVKLSSKKYYSMVTNLENYKYMTQTLANNSGYSQAEKGNQYAKP